MDFFAKVRRATAVIVEHGRMSRRGLVREFGDGVDDETIDDIAAELVVRGIAHWENDILVADRPDGLGEPRPFDSGDDENESGERRNVTVMFCDVIGSTELSGQLDVEVWNRAMRSFHTLAAAGIEQWGGHVGNYMGDGLVAYFGYPVAREDAAERAVRAGLAIVDGLPALNLQLAASTGRDLSCRVGIHTGPVVVDEFGGVTQAMGETPNIAARLEGAAPANGIVISPATRRLVSGVFVTEDLGHRELKGVAKPMQLTAVTRVGGVAPQLGAGRSSRTPLVGRQLELGLLDDRWRQVCDGWGQVVVVTGEAGIGKSRLIETFRESLIDDAHSWLDASCSPYSQSAPMFPIAELQRRGLGFTADAAPSVKREQLGRGLRVVELDAARGVALLSELHGIEIEDPVVSTMSADQRRADIFDLVIDWIIGLARLQPTVFFIDDLHWSDPTTRAVLGRLVDQLATEQLMLIVAARPDRPPEWTPRGNITPLQLTRMTRDQTARVASGAAGTELDADMIESIVQRCDGVPLFAEELAAAMLNTNEGSEAVPASLQDLLMARLEQLGPLRDVAQMASIIGREFRFDEASLLSPVGDDELSRLLEVGVREELLYQRGAGAERSFIFKHALMRDAVYESMLASTRQRHHRRFATAIVDTRSQLARDRPDLIAEHLSEGGDRKLASQWWERAADVAASIAAYHEAETFYRNALDTSPSQEDADLERRVALTLNLAGAMNATRGWGHSDLEPLWDDIDRQAKQAGLTLPVAIAHLGRALRYALQGDFSASHAEIEHVHDHDDPGVALSANVLSALLACFEGHPHRTIELLEAEAARDDVNTELIGATLGISVYPTMHIYLAYARALAGRFDSAVDSLEAACKLADDMNNPLSQANARALAASVHDFRGETDRFLEVNSAGLEIARRYRLGFFTALGAIHDAFTTARVHRDASQIPVAEALLAELGADGTLVGAPHFICRIGQAQLVCGMADDAALSAELATAIAGGTNQRFRDPAITALGLRAAYAVGTMNDGWRESAAEAMDFAIQRGLAADRLELASTVAQISTDTPALPEALRDLRDAINAIAEPDGVPVVEEAEALHAELSSSLTT